MCGDTEGIEGESKDRKIETEVDREGYQSI